MSGFKRATNTIASLLACPFPGENGIRSPLIEHTPGSGCGEANAASLLHFLSPGANRLDTRPCIPRNREIFSRAGTKIPTANVGLMISVDFTDSGYSSANQLCAYWPSFHSHPEVCVGQIGEHTSRELHPPEEQLDGGRWKTHLHSPSSNTASHCYETAARVASS
jgi:hypothetical protein